MTLSFRVATIDEAALVREIMLVAYAEYLGVLPVDSGAHTETVDDVLEVMRKGGAVLAADGDQAVGSARFIPEEGHLYVGRVAVLPSHRRRRVASGMMRLMDDVATGLGLDAVHVGVRESLPSNVGLYRSLGFEVLSIEPHPRGPDRTLTMVKPVRY